ncbi:non-ribosomal peptide synthetase [Streptomyces halstedii]|uniref:non-ribosomal peptide synthetase n=1 Tax=Streptomyces halstedii TaxID=1944 RepID=UPI0033BD1EC7
MEEDGRHLAYGELDRLVTTGATALAARGVGHGTVVGLTTTTLVDTVVAVLATLARGAVFLPLDLGLPADRVEYMTQKADCRLVIGEKTVDGVGLITPTQLAAPAEDAAAQDGASTTATGPDDGVYIMFTSGSTGRPKGVLMHNGPLRNLTEWQLDALDMDERTRFLQYAPLGFDVSFQEIFSTLCGGGTLVVLAEEQRRDMPALLRLLDEERVQRVCLPYVALQQLAETSQALGLVPRHLKALLSSGEQLRVTDEIRRLCAEVPGIILENQYGPTESHVVTSHTMTGDPAAFPAMPPIGTAIDGSRALVLDARLRPVPAGVKGEIHLAGSCLADGYVGLPELTEERFLPHPSGAPGERLYRTGDLGFTLPGGEIVCLGRADSQVKIRGYRVEPSEVELAITGFLGDHPGLTEAAVVARRRRDDESFLAAFLVGRLSDAGRDLLDKQLRSVLPEYMVPSYYQVVDALPLTPSGKRDDAALRRAPLAASTAHDVTPPRDAYEHTLAEIVRDHLQLSELGADFERTTDIDLGVRAEDLIALPYADQPAHLLARAQRAGALDENDGPDFVDRLLGLYRANRTALDRYRPATGHHGPLLLLSAADSGADGSAVPAEASRGWQHWSTTGLVVRTVPGDHYSVLHTDHLDRLANRLRSHTLTGASR